MTRAARRDTLRTIKKSLSRYFSILMIVAIGIGFFAGIRATGADMRSTASAYFSAQDTMDVHLLSTLGFSDTDVTLVASTPGVKAVVPSKFVDCITLCANNFVTRVFSLPAEEENSLNHLRVLEGRLPLASNECIVDQNVKEKFGFSVGDTLTLSSAKTGEKLEDQLDCVEYTIVGIANSPLYIDMTKRGTTSVGDGSVDAFIYVPEQNFTADYYSVLYVTAEDAAGLECYTDEYRQAVAPLIDRLEALGEQRSQPRLEEMLSTSQEKIDDAKQQIEDAKVEIADGKQQLTDAEKKIADGKAELADAKKKYEDGKKEFDEKIADAEAELRSGSAELDSGWAKYNDGLNQYNSAKATLDASLPQVEAAEAQATALAATCTSLDGALTPLTSATMTDIERKAAVVGYGLDTALNAFTNASGTSLGLGDLLYDQTTGDVTVGTVTAARGALAGYLSGVQQQVQQARADYDNGVQQLAATKVQLDAAKQQLLDGGASLGSGQSLLETSRKQGQKELDDAAQKIADADRKLSDAEQEYLEKSVDAKQQIADAEIDVADAEQKLRDAEEDLADLKPAEWYVDDRSDAMPGYAEFSDDADRMDNISTIFPVFFLAVAALVCLTTMARMVEEQRTEIGTMKALGYEERSIRQKYLIYSLSATVIGCVAGLAAGFKLFPTVIFDAYCILYDLPGVNAPFHWGVAVICCVVAVICVLLVTCSVCRSVLRETPASIMRPKAPPAGKRVLLERITFLWKRLSFSQKVTLRNLFRYKKRVFMTIFGIAGSAALILTGYGLNDAIGDIVSNQFQKVFRYDLLAAYSNDDPEDVAALYAMLDESAQVDEWMPQYRQTLTVEGGPKEFEVGLVVSRDYERLEDYISLQERKSGSDLGSPARGVDLTEKLADLMGLSVGDSITVRDSDNNEFTMEIVSISENYASHFAYISEEYYREVFGEAPQYNTAIINLSNPDDLHSFSQELIDGGTVQMISSNAELLDQYKNVTENLGYVVAVLIVSAGLLAFVVLYNLSNINITERVREIATLKVLGFYDGEVSAYIYRENIILTILGTGVGLLLGTALTSFVVSTAEIDSIMFGRNIYWPSFLIAAALTCVFSFLVNWVMHYKLKKISMVESMKSID